MCLVLLTGSMKTLAYHEGIPGHHFQIGIQTELNRTAEPGLPIFRTIIPFTAYGEGWALYSEQLAYELGFYKNDPFGNLGRLQAEIWRSVRLVVDTGIHYKRWTREKAIDYMVANTGMADSEVTTEIERYFVLPGQACAYKIGIRTADADEDSGPSQESKAGTRPQIRFEAISPGRFSEWRCAAVYSGGKY